MTQRIQIKECEEYTMLISDIANIEFNKNYEFDHEKMRSILVAMVNDILLLRKDAKVTVSFYFSTRKLQISYHKNKLYPQLPHHGNLDIPYNAEGDMNKILNDIIDESLDESPLCYPILDLELVNKTFNNIQILDEVLGFSGELYKYAKNNQFSSYYYKQKDQFYGYELERSANDSICIVLYKGNKKITVYREGIHFNIDGINVEFYPERMDKDKDVVTTIKNFALLML